MYVHALLQQRVIASGSERDRVKVNEIERASLRAIEGSERDSNHELVHFAMHAHHLLRCVLGVAARRSCVASVCAWMHTRHVQYLHTLDSN